MTDQISTKVKNARYKTAMQLQQRIAREQAEAKVGQTLKLLVDQPLIARTEADAPDVELESFSEPRASRGIHPAKNHRRPGIRPRRLGDEEIPSPNIQIPNNIQ